MNQGIFRVENARVGAASAGTEPWTPVILSPTSSIAVTPYLYAVAEDWKVGKYGSFIDGSK